LDEARRKEELTLKLLIVGPPRSGKSTILKQFRYMHGDPWTDEELRVYGATIRSNITAAIRHICRLLGRLGLEEELSREIDVASNYSEGDTGISPRQAFDRLCDHLLIDDSNTNERGESPHDGGDSPTKDNNIHGRNDTNKDVGLFLDLWREMKALWQVG
jgi:hypothetical protein